MIKGKLNLFDIYGTHFTFTNFGESKFHTWVGLLLSLLSFGVLLAFLFVFGDDLIYHKNPTILTLNSRPNDYFTIMPNQTNFTFAWRIFDQNTRTWNFTGILFPYIDYYRYKQNPNTKILEKIYENHFDPEVCSESNVFDENFKSSKSIAMKDWNCIDFQKKNMTLGGTLDGFFVDYFRIRLYACKNNKRSEKCTSLEDLKKLFITENKLYFSVLMPEFYFDPQNDNPLKYEYTNRFNQLSQNLIKKDRIYLKNVAIWDDQDYFLSSIYKKTNLTVAGNYDKDYYIKLDEDYTKNELSTELYTFTVYFDKGGDIYIRSFMKVQELAARLGGFTQIILIIGEWVAGLFNTYLRNITLFNILFDFYKTPERKNSFANDESKIGTVIHEENVLKSSQKKTVTFEHEHMAREIKIPSEEHNIIMKESGDDRDSQQDLNNDENVFTTVPKRRGKLLSKTLKYLGNPNDILGKIKKVERKEESSNNVKSLTDDDEEKDFRLSKSLCLPRVNIQLSIESESDFEFKDTRSVNIKKDEKTWITNLFFPKNKKSSFKSRNFRRLSTLNVAQKCKTILPNYEASKEETLKKLIQEKKEEASKHRKPFTLGLTLCLKKLLCFKDMKAEESQTFNIYKCAIKYVEEKLDIVKYINLNSNFEKFVSLSLNDIQKSAFYRLRKPNILKKDDHEIFDLDLSDELVDRIVTEGKKLEDLLNQDVNIVKYFTQKIKDLKGNPTNGLEPIDFQLYNLLDHKLKTIIDKELA